MAVELGTGFQIGCKIMFTRESDLFKVGHKWRQMDVAEQRPHFKFKSKFALIVGHHLVVYVSQIDKNQLIRLDDK